MTLAIFKDAPTYDIRLCYKHAAQRCLHIDFIKVNEMLFCLDVGSRLCDVEAVNVLYEK